MQNTNSDKRLGFETANVPPHCLSSERAILGIILQDNEVIDNISITLSVDDFYVRQHQIIYDSILKLISSGAQADVITVFNNISKAFIENTGLNMEYLSSLIEGLHNTRHIKEYVNIVQGKATLRRLISAGNEIISNAFESSDSEDVKQILDQAEAKIFAINEEQGKIQSGFLNYKNLIAKVTGIVEDLHARESDLTGLESGFPDLDKLTSGLQAGDLIIVAGRPSMGKTTLAINIAEYMAIDLDLPVAIFSMEMSAVQIAMRTIVSRTLISQQRLRSGKLRDEEWPVLVECLKELKSKQINIDETPALTPSDIRSRARKLTRKVGQLGCIIVDYIQLMSGTKTSNKMENRAGEISEISRSLKILAKELKCPVIALSQLNRSLEQRPNKRPIMSDLRESGAIEQDADLILFIYRDEVYNTESQQKGQAEIIIAKQRNGPIGTIHLGFQGEFSRFVSLDSYHSYDD